MIVEIIPVTDRKTLKRFIDVPNRINASDPCWIPPLNIERGMAFSAKHNSVLRRSDNALWIAHQNGTDVGRISAQVDPLGNAVHSAPQGHFGCFAAIDDPAVCSRLLETAEAFVSAHGPREIYGPYTFSINEETGLLVDGFDTPPMLMMGHDPSYCDARLRENGYETGKEMLAYLLDISKPMTSSLSRMLFRPVADNVTIRSLDFSDYRNEIRRIVDIHNDAWSENWGFVPLTEDQTDELASHLRLLLDKRLVRFAEIDGQAVAFIVVLPNLNEACRDLNGRLFPFGWAKMLWRLKVGGVGSARVPLMGVKRQVAGTLAGSALPLQLIGAVWPSTRERGISQVELSWILEDNRPMRKTLERLGADPYKTYRIYRKALG